MPIRNNNEEVGAECQAQELLCTGSFQPPDAEKATREWGLLKRLYSFACSTGAGDASVGPGEPAFGKPLRVTITHEMILLRELPRFRIHCVPRRSSALLH
jgi:hypothetical protein